MIVNLSPTLKELAVCWGGDDIKEKNFKSSYVQILVSAIQEKNIAYIKSSTTRGPNPVWRLGKALGGSGV